MQCMDAAQSNEIAIGTTALVQHFRLKGEFTSARERRLKYIWYGLAISLAYLNREEGVISLVQKISSCLRDV